MSFVVGDSYNRRDIFERLGLPIAQRGGPWFTGLVEHSGASYIFCAVQAAGRTGHDYKNHFQGDDLLWYGRVGSKLSHPSIQSLLDPAAVVRVFYRSDDRAPFVFAGHAKHLRAWDESPVKVLWSFADDPLPHMEFLAEELAPGDAVVEGARKTITINVYERDPSARKRCIDRWGAVCSVCGFEFVALYGELGRGFIHVHHVRPLAEVGEAYILDPENDLRPVCPNCHAMLHRRRPALSIDELKLLLLL